VIRFVDLRHQGTGNRFAFFDTGADVFFELDGNHAFQDWEGFLRRYHAAPFGNDKKLLGRLEGLCPEWVYQKPTEDELVGFKEEK
jgi:hypothetical protein